MIQLEALYRIENLAARYPSVFRSAGALRWAVFSNREELEEAGALVRLGRRLYISKPHFESWLAAKNGRAAAE